MRSSVPPWRGILRKVRRWTAQKRENRGRATFHPAGFLPPRPAFSRFLAAGRCGVVVGLPPRRSFQGHQEKQVSARCGFFPARTDGNNGTDKFQNGNGGDGQQRPPRNCPALLLFSHGACLLFAPPPLSPCVPLGVSWGLRSLPDGGGAVSGLFAGGFSSHPAAGGGNGEKQLAAFRVRVSLRALDGQRPAPRLVRASGLSASVRGQSLPPFHSRPSQPCRRPAVCPVSSGPRKVGKRVTVFPLSPCPALSPRLA